MSPMFRVNAVKVGASQKKPPARIAVNRTEAKPSRKPLDESEQKNVDQDKYEKSITKQSIFPNFLDCGPGKIKDYFIESSLSCVKKKPEEDEEQDFYA
mmetsp:Transcript_9538/g.14593  ORF Transcript_9538/g.14593 Transcript_9538/m.14593 type:complete len:98 (+) Transcript_9538:370-663(+)